MANLTATKPIDALMREAQDTSEHCLKRTLGPVSLIMLGIGAIIGWDLVLEYAVGAATVAIAWSEYFNRVLGWFNARIPYEWSHSPLETMADTGARGIINLPAIFILLILSALLIKGTKESAIV